MDGRRFAGPLPAALFLLLAFALPARADDPPAPDAPPPDAPKEEPKSDEPKKPKSDDTNIFTDWKKFVKPAGIQNARNRAKYWEDKGTTGKSLMWLGFMWERGEVFDKAAAAWEGFLAWKPPEGDSKDAVRDREAYGKNRETVSKQIVNAYLWKGDYAAALKGGATYREEFPNSSGIPESWDWEGQAYRLSGDEAKALESFGKAAELKHIGGFLNVVDIHLTNGQIDAAKEAFAKYSPEEAKAPFLKDVKAFLDKVGTDAPPLSSAVNVGSGTPPTDWKGRVTATIHWHVQLPNVVTRLRSFDKVVTEAGDKAQGLAITKYHKINAETDKKEEDMSEEKEAEGVRKYVAGVLPRDIPAPVVMANAAVAELGLKLDGQIVIVDAEGKLRYMRVNDMKKYDLKAVGYALKKLTTPAGGEPAK
jgi:tetratricopeptide (TPR) repeat protein